MMQKLRWLGLSVWTLVLCACVGPVLGVSAYTFWYARGLSYFSTNPEACVNCHIMREQFDDWQRASHHAHAKCIDCHLPHDFVGKYTAKAENGFWHSAHFTLQDYPEPIRIKGKNAHILQANCIQCHQEVVGDLLAHGTFSDGSVSCVHCHVAVGHGAPR